MREGFICGGAVVMLDRERSARFWHAALLARDYPSPPSVELRHDRGKLHCG